MSPEAPKWECAMREELDSLKENDTFELTSLPKGRNVVGGDGSMPLKKILEEKRSLKLDTLLRVTVREKVHCIDYHETFASTANLTSV